MARLDSELHPTRRFRPGRRNAAIVIAVFAAGVGLFWISGIGRVHGRWVRSFDSAVWKATPARGMTRAPIRQLMVDDLLRRGKLIGRTRPEAEDLIGPPDEKSYFNEFDMVYYLGDERGLMSIDSEWLVIKLDASGRVIEARLATD